jgi:hypothetical protein
MATRLILEEALEAKVADLLGLSRISNIPPF